MMEAAYHNDAFVFDMKHKLAVSVAARPGPFRERVDEYEEFSRLKSGFGPKSSSSAIGRIVNGDARPVGDIVVKV
jgi:hypothetical protein